MGVFDYYLIGINVVGFVSYLINMFLYSHTISCQIDTALTVVSFLGGSAGIVLAILFFDRKAKKGNMMSRVFVICIFIIQVVLFLMIKGYRTNHITLAFWDFFSEHKVILAYLIIINIIAFAVFAIDKAAAIDKRSRVRIVTLLSLAFLGGSIGSLFAMHLLHHKTKKDYFSVGIPLIIVMQLFVLFYVMNVR